MLFSLEVLQAYHGDCLILHYGEPMAPRFLVVDGGPAHVYENSLGPRLDVLRQKWRPDKKLSIDLLMVTHVDDDHIHGVLDLMSDLARKKEKKIPAPYQILTLWHNSFGDLVGGVEPTVFTTLGASIDPEASGSSLPLNQRSHADLGAIAASIGQGQRLYHLAKALNLVPLNHPFRGLVMTRAGDSNLAPLGRNLMLRVLHPEETRIKNLQKEWQKAATEAKNTRATSVLTAAYEDKAVANLSSIVVMAECGNKRMLLTGDARGDDILQGMTQAGLMSNGTCTVDILKLPHHGSNRDVAPDFFRSVLARHYVISANGEYDNPDADTLDMLVAARSDDDFTLHLTNRTGKKGLGKKIEKFLQKKDAAGRHYRVNFPANADESIMIDLLDEVTY